MCFRSMVTVEFQPSHTVARFSKYLNVPNMHDCVWGATAKTMPLLETDGQLYSVHLRVQTLQGYIEMVVVLTIHVILLGV